MNLSSFQKFAKIGVLGIIVLAGLAGTILLGREASNYFARASTCPVSKAAASQVTGNSAVVNWETDDVTQGRVEYGTNAANLAFSAPETVGGKTHNVPLSLLTPNTVYYYLITIGKTRCDSTNQPCTDKCVPWSFTTSTITPVITQPGVPTVVPSVTIKLSPTKSASPSVTRSPSGPVVSPTSGLSVFCKSVELNIGASSQDATKWATLKTYDVDNNGRINGVDVIKCQAQGK